MEVFALRYTVGYETGYKELVGIYSTTEKAEEAKRNDMQKNIRGEWKYSIFPLQIDKTVNHIYQEW